MQNTFTELAEVSIYEKHAKRPKSKDQLISWDTPFIPNMYRYPTLPTVPTVGLCRCASLKKLILARNKLITLPEAIHLTELLVLDLKVGTVPTRPSKPVPYRPVPTVPHQC